MFSVRMGERSVLLICFYLLVYLKKFVFALERAVAGDRLTEQELQR